MMIKLKRMFGSLISAEIKKRNSAVFVCIPNWHVFWNSNFKNVVQSIILLMFDVAVLFCYFSIHFCWHFTSSKVEKICKDKKKENTSRVRQKSHFFSSSLSTLPVLFYKYLQPWVHIASGTSAQRCCRSKLRRKYPSFQLSRFCQA